MAVQLSHYEATCPNCGGTAEVIGSACLCNFCHYSFHTPRHITDPAAQWEFITLLIAFAAMVVINALSN